jgi:transcriptional regulator with XRE-family HTH domain
MRTVSEDLAYITPRVVTWARERSGFSLTELGNRLGVTTDQFLAWERGESRPPFEKAQKLANILHIPFGYLFLSEPPQLDIPLPDFRTLEGSYTPTADFIDLLNSVLIKQDWYKEYLLSTGEGKPTFVGKFRINDDVESVASSSPW